MGFSIWQLVIVLLVVVVLFGTKKLRNLGSDLGEAVKGFKKGVKDDEEAARDAEPQVIEATATEENETETASKVASGKNS